MLSVNVVLMQKNGDCEVEASFTEHEGARRKRTRTDLVERRMETAATYETKVILKNIRERVGNGAKTLNDERLLR